MKSIIVLLVAVFAVGCVATVDVPKNIYGIEQAPGDEAALNVDLGPVEASVSVKVYGWKLISGWVSTGIDTVVDLVDGLREVSPTEE